VILQKSCEVGPDETLGDVYFNKLFPLGVSAMLEAADLVHAGKHTETVQDESQATYEGWCRSAEARIDRAKPVVQVYDLIRGCNPAPGAWTTLGGKKLFIFESRKRVFRRFADVSGKIGEVAAITEQGIQVTAAGGQIEVSRVRHEDGKKIPAVEFARAAGLTAGTLLGS
jgi:methionyl-tRNA formyltransferase